jgi:hypothetical protein
MTIVIHSGLPAWPDRVRLDGRFKYLYTLRDTRRHPEATIAYIGLQRATQRATHRGFPPCQQLQVNPPVFADGVRDGKAEGMPRLFVFSRDHSSCVVLHPMLPYPKN